MLRKLSVVLVSAGALALGGCSSTSTPSDGGQTINLCTGIASPCVPFPAGTTETTISTAISTAATNTTFVFDTGTFSFTNALTLPDNSTGVTLKGQSMTGTILDFGGQVAGAAGLNATGASKLTFTKFTVQNTPGDGIKVTSANGVLFLTVQATWTNASNLTHGAYGIYPVQSQNVVVDGCHVSGARDTGIYVGQSFDIIVRNNLVSGNVAGIEIESSVSADVYGNESTANSGGILVFALPTLLPPPGSGVETDQTLNVRVFNNNVHANNTFNFGDPSGTVSAVPGGTGLVVMAGDNVEVFGNTIANNNTAAYSVISYFLINPSFDPTDPGQNPTGLNPFSNNVYAHDNTFSGNGTNPIGENVSPDGGTSENQLGFLLAGLLLEGGFTGNSNGNVPDMLWDGIANEGPPLMYVPPPSPANASSVGSPPNPINYFVSGNGTASFSNLNFPVLLPCGNATCLTLGALVFNVAPFTVTSPPAGFPLPGVDAGF
jgi:parallel beta-helix repeat protein